MQDKEAKFIETGSNDMFDVSFTNSDSIYDLTVHGDRLIFSEHYILIKDTLYLQYRDIKLMGMSKLFTFDPLRPRMILPLVESEFSYSGIEHSFAYKSNVNSRTVILKDDSIFNVLTITDRAGKPDTSSMSVSDTYVIRKITLDIPAFLGIYKLFGFNSPNLEFVRYEESQ